VGAVAGSFIGGDSNAARTPDDPPAAAAGRAAVAVDATPTVVAAAASRTAPIARGAAENKRPSDSTQAARAPEPSAASVIATRFPPRWHRAGSAEIPATQAPQALAYAAAPAGNAMPHEVAQRGATSENSSYQLASIDPMPPMPKKRAARPAPKNPTLFNDAQIASIKQRLRLTRDQEQYWPPVATALRAIGWRVIRQSDSRRPVRGNPAAAIDPNSPEVEQLKAAAFPLIMSLREDQKREVRQLAHTMGLSKVAAMF
jgi:hypothetical protein